MPDFRYMESSPAFPLPEKLLSQAQVVYTNASRTAWPLCFDDMEASLRTGIPMSLEELRIHTLLMILHK